MNETNKRIMAIFALASIAPMSAMNKSSNTSGIAYGQRSASSTSGIQLSGSDGLTKEEQEAIDADIAFSLMQKEFSELSIGHSSSSGLEDADFAYALQLETEEVDTPPASRPVLSPVSSIRSSTDSRLQSTLSDRVIGRRRAASDRVESVVSDLLKNSGRRSPLKNVLVCGKNENSQRRIVDDLLHKTLFWGRILSHRYMNFSSPNDWTSEDTLKKYFQDATREVMGDKKSMIIIHLNNLLEKSLEDKIRTLSCLRDFTRELSNKYMVVIVADSSDNVDPAYVQRVKEGTFEVIFADEDYSNVRTENGTSCPMHVRKAVTNVSESRTASYANAVNSPTANTASATSSTSTSVTESNAGPEECSICLEAKTDMNTPCCIKKICQLCWESSLKASAGAGGRNPRHCPFCRTEESAWNK